jgi:hypothetical protein
VLPPVGLTLPHPFQDAGYDVANYNKSLRYEYRLDTIFGGSNKGIRSFGLVPGAASSTSWFIESCKPERNQYTVTSGQTMPGSGKSPVIGSLVVILLATVAT